ncbi:unnamed protein product [Closterium sp. Yama58-4]|nr:unnamed protein product [Closterium sp. Yama58-4]
MGRRPSSSSSSSRFKYLRPSYYIRRPRRLGLLTLLVVGIVFVVMDRQRQAKELEALATQLDNLEGEKSHLIVELEQARLTGSVSHGQAGGKAASVRKDPLILGIVRAGAAGGMLRGGEKTGQAYTGDAIIRDAVTGDAHSADAEQKALSELQRLGKLDDDGLGGGEGDSNEGKAADGLEDADLEDDVAVAGGGKSGGGGGVRVGGVTEAGGEQLQSEQRKEVSVAEQRAAEKQTQGQGQGQGLLLRGQDETERRRESIRQGMLHAWRGYKKYAWGSDELQPRSKTPSNNFGGMGATIVDSLDTLFLMGLKDEFRDAQKWVAESLNFNRHSSVSVFETTIRMLGGLLAAYDLSGEKVFLEKAKELGDRLLPAFNTPTGIPFAYVDLASGGGNAPGWTGGSAVLADLGTLQLEFVTLSQRTGDPKYAIKAENVIKQIEKIFPEDGLVPMFISIDSGEPTSSHITFGSMGDSFYEYLIKMWVHGGKTPVVKKYRDMWEKSINGMFSRLVQRTPDQGGHKGFSYVPEMEGGGLIRKMEHLTCFVPGMLILGMPEASPADAAKYLDLAKELTRTCYEFYNSTPSKLAGEDYNFHNDGPHLQGRVYNILRPEAVEAIWYSWRATKDPMYREWGWKIWQAFEKNCRVEAGYVGLEDAGKNPPPQDNMQQSFFLAETLKYLYLLFSPDDTLNLDKWVINTEAHPIKITPPLDCAGDAAAAARRVPVTADVAGDAAANDDVTRGKGGPWPSEVVLTAVLTGDEAETAWEMVEARETGEGGVVEKEGEGEEGLVGEEGKEGGDPLLVVLSSTRAAAASTAVSAPQSAALVTRGRSARSAKDDSSMGASARSSASVAAAVAASIKA